MCVAGLVCSDRVSRQHAGAPLPWHSLRVADAQSVFGNGFGVPPLGGPVRKPPKGGTPNPAPWPSWRFPNALSGQSVADCQLNGPLACQRHNNCLVLAIELIPGLAVCGDGAY